jgi:hypothetical protein
MARIGRFSEAKDKLVGYLIWAMEAWGWWLHGGRRAAARMEDGGGNKTGRVLYRPKREHG